MKRPYTLLGGLILVLVIIAVGRYAYMQRQLAASHPTNVISTASYLCRDGKTIDASYTANSVTLTLSDTRALVLPQVQSGSGIRYEKGNAVFTSKGNNALLEENGTTTFADCVANGSPSPIDAQGANGMKRFSDAGGIFTFMYPSNVIVSGGDGSYTQSWMNNATSSGMVLAKATLGKSFQPNTNFSEATLMIGTDGDPSAVSTCLTYNSSGGPAQKPTVQTINGVTYTVFHSNDAAAGNRYDTTSYRTLRNNQCYVVEYTIHSTALGNYSPDQHISAFNESAVTKVMNDIVQSVTFTDGA
jgi:membrane-bound inhibitor of C-type lysozyme